MAQRSFTVGIPEELEGRVVAAARSLDITRNAFVRRALEAALGQREGADRAPAPARTNPPSPVPPRTFANYGAHERYGPRRPRPKGS